MNKFTELFDRGKVFVAYITAGQRGLECTKQAAIALVQGGVDILEIGVPFSDPIADGPTIQLAMNDALSSSVDLPAILETISEIKKVIDVPIILFSYSNPFFKMGLSHIFERIKHSGADGTLLVDCPLEESDVYFRYCKEYAIEPICIISPSTDKDRALQITKQCNSFIYYVCRNSVTGMKNSLPDNYAEKLKTLKKLTSKPIVTGFGISSRELAAIALEHSDGFVVGSAFVKAISEGATPDDLRQLALDIDPRP